ncbi:MAG: hypothetical protein KGI80_01895 [Verrucomicrobiota bacterium]|nr:hypothetical protein [Verrucomicrobiota bacterium]
MKRLFFLSLFLFFFSLPLVAEETQTKILHLTMHKGCAAAFSAIAKEMNATVTTWHVSLMPPRFMDDVTTDGGLFYNMTHRRAEAIWKKHRDFFEQFDLICVSDTSPLSRIFLQNGFKKPLLIWICNRFDYSEERLLDEPFPDQEYYDLFAQAKKMPNVRIVGYTRFENYYAYMKGIDIGSACLPPCVQPQAAPILPSRELFLLPPYHNETIFMDLQAHLNGYGVPAKCTRYNGPLDMASYKGVICLPYSWSNLALFEGLALGVPYFIPSREFFLDLAHEPNYFLPNLGMLLAHDLIDLTEWYDPSREEAFIFFDSWEDLVEKVKTTDYEAQRAKVLAYAKKFYKETMQGWKELFKEMLPGKNI